jgi:hypothetical protein
MKRLAVASAVLALLVGLGGCTRDRDTSPGTGLDASTPATTTDPLGLCRQALPDRDVISATRTTVGDLRAWGYSGPLQKHPLGNAFPASAPTEPAAWCWTREAVDSYTAWGVHAPDLAERAITVTGPTDEIPAGPPIIP